MRRLISLCVVLGTLVAAAAASSAQARDPISALLDKNQTDLATEGRTFLIEEAGRVSFFLIGGRHGDNETPALVQTLAPALRPFGYLYTATEMSPWAASRFPIPAGGAVRDPLWGLDIETEQLQDLIRAFGVANPQNEVLKTMVGMTAKGYRRSQAPTLLPLLRQTGKVTDIVVQGTSVRDLLIRTLEVENQRLDPELTLEASVDRESFMKDTFIANYRRVSNGDVKAKVMLVFGQNHLPRGYNNRGVSTLGKFVAQIGAADGLESFHVALFAAGGKVSLGGLVDADQRKDETAFEWLASVAKYPATVFDLRPLRELLRGKPAATLSMREASLLYWAESYDAIVCYREVTPSGAAQPDK